MKLNVSRIFSENKIIEIITENISRAFSRAHNDIVKNKLAGMLIVFLFIFIFLNLDFYSTINWILFFAFLIYNWESRIIVVGSLFYLFFCFIFLLFNQYGIAEKMAVQAFFLLIMSVVLQIVEYRRNPKLFIEDDDEAEEIDTSIETSIEASKSPRRKNNFFKKLMIKFEKIKFNLNLNIFIFLGLAILILWKLLLPGYVLTLDMVFGPELQYVPIDGKFLSSLPVGNLIYWLGLIFSPWIAQKIMLVTLFSLIGYLAFKYLPVGKNKIVCFFSALIYLLNPFVYTRLLAGQWLVLWGYAFLPPLLNSLFVFQAKKDLKSALKLFGWLFLIGVFSNHFFMMSAILLAVWFAFISVKDLIVKNDWQILKFWKNIILGGIMFLILSSYWLIPALTRKAPLEERFGLPQWEYFAAGGYQEISPLLNLISLNGFWGERYPWAESFLWPQDYLTFWIAISLLAILIIFGIFKGLKDKKEKNKTLIFIIIGILALIFSAGAGKTIFRNFNLFFFENVPLWTGFRDSQKFSGFLVLAYAVLAGLGLGYFLDWLKEKKFAFTNLLVPFFFLIPFFLGYLMWGGFHGQLKPVWYPESWFEAKEILDQDKSKSQVLVLPWHGYLSFDFTNDLIIGNPARRFFGERTIAGRDFDNEKKYEQEIDFVYLQINKAIQKDKKNADIIEMLREEKVKYVIFFQDLIEVDPLEYPWLKNEALELIFKSPDLQMYQIRKK